MSPARHNVVQRLSGVRAWAFWNVRGWSVWKEPRRVVILVVGVIAVNVAAIGVSAATVHCSPGN